MPINSYIKYTNLLFTIVIKHSFIMCNKDFKQVLIIDAIKKALVNTRAFLII
jgi:hypothetical protein